jgi:hypothetical protein
MQLVKQQKFDHLSDSSEMFELKNKVFQLKVNEQPIRHIWLQIRSLQKVILQALYSKNQCHPFESFPRDSQHFSMFLQNALYSLDRTQLVDMGKKIETNYWKLSL